MTVTDTSLEELADKADRAAAALIQRRTFEEARAALNEAGMLRARNLLWDSVDRIAAAQASVRVAADAVRYSKQLLDRTLGEVEWELDAEFVFEGAKAFLVVNDENGEPVRKSMTADQRKEWKRLEARKTPKVRTCLDALEADEAILAASRDELTVAEKFNQAARADVDAAIATVTTLAASIKKETAQ